MLNEKKSLHFVTHNLFELKSEASKGSGQYLNAFSEVVGCHPDSLGQLKKEIKKNYNRVFIDSNPEAVLENVYRVIFSNEELATACTLS